MCGGLFHSVIIGANLILYYRLVFDDGRKLTLNGSRLADNRRCIVHDAVRTAINVSIISSNRVICDLIRKAKTPAVLPSSREMPTIFKRSFWVSSSNLSSFILFSPTPTQFAAYIFVLIAEQRWFERNSSPKKTLSVRGDAERSIYSNE